MESDNIMDRSDTVKCFSENGLNKTDNISVKQKFKPHHVHKIFICLALTVLFFSGCASSRSGNIVSRNDSIQDSNQLQAVSNEPDEEIIQLDEEVIQLTSAEDFESGIDETSSLAIRTPESGNENSLNYYIQVALSTNPEILAAQHRLAAQSQVVPQVTSLDDPNLVDTFQPFDNHSVQTAAGRGPNTLSLSQKFPWFGKLDTRGRVAQANVQVAHTQLTQAKLKVIEDVNLAYYDVYYNQKAIQITIDDSKFLTQLIRAEDAKFRVGGKQQNLIRTQVELDKLDNRLILLKRQFRQSQADLAEVTQVDPESNLTASRFDVPSAPKQIEQLYEAAISSRPEIQERLHTIIRNQHEEELAHLDYKPDVTFGLGWQAITNDDAISPVTNSNDNVAFTIGINLPIWRDKLQAGVNEAQHRRAESTRRYEAVRDDTFRMIRRLSVQANSLEEQIVLFRDKIIPREEKILRLYFNNYRTGNIDFQQLLDDWSNLLALHIQLVRMESDLGKTLASLERVVGQEMITFTANVPDPAPKPAPASVPELNPTPEKQPAPVLPIPAFEE
jgi:outer membrane protein, heavy metal efflux system